MASPTLIDATRGTPMADKPKRKNWIKAAVPESHKGVFKAKAEKAGESTKAYAEAHKHDSGRTGQQARLALTLMGESQRRARMYPSMKKG